MQPKNETNARALTKDDVGSWGYRLAWCSPGNPNCVATVQISEERLWSEVDDFGSPNKDWVIIRKPKDEVIFEKPTTLDDPIYASAVLDFTVPDKEFCYRIGQIHGDLLMEVKRLRERCTDLTQSLTAQAKENWGLTLKLQKGYRLIQDLRRELEQDGQL